MEDVSSNPQTSSPPPITSHVAIGLILILAAALRIHGLGDQSLWFDEAATVRIVRQGFGEMFASIREGERIPPLHYVILWGWVRVFGQSQWSVRLPSALAGTGAVWVLYLLTRRLFGVGAALVAGLLLAVAPFQVEYSQEARSYSLMLLLSLASCLLFVRMLAEPKARLDASYVLISAAALYSHLYALFTLIAQAIAYAVAWMRSDGRPPATTNTRIDPREAPPLAAGFVVPVEETRRKRRRFTEPLLNPKRWLLAQIGIAALFLAWLPITIRWATSVGSGFWVAPMSGDDLSATYLAYAGGSVAAVMILALLVVSGLAEARRRSPVGYALMLALATLPVVVPVIVSILTKPTFTPRYGIVAPAALYALAGCGIVALRHRAAQAVALVALLALSFNAMGSIALKPDWRGAVAHLDRVTRPGDYVVMTPRLSTYLFDLYATRADIRRKGFDSGAIPLSVPLAEGVTVWLIFEPRYFVANAVLARGGWQIRSAKRFQGLIVLELDDNAALASFSGGREKE